MKLYQSQHRPSALGVLGFPLIDEPDNVFHGLVRGGRTTAGALATNGSVVHNVEKGCHVVLVEGPLVGLLLQKFLDQNVDLEIIIRFVF